MSPLCFSCRTSLEWAALPWCTQCGCSLAHPGKRCAECTRRSFHFERAISPLRYEGTVKKLIVELKYKGHFSVTTFLGQIVAQTIRDHLGKDPADACVPVPLHPTRLRERSYNQALLVAQEISRHLSLPCWKDLLIRKKVTRSQADLNKEKRLANVRNAFDLRPHPLLPGARILLVDDVLTTGATANACAHLLKENRAAAVSVVTIAHG